MVKVTLVEYTTMAKICGYSY